MVCNYSCKPSKTKTFTTHIKLQKVRNPSPAARPGRNQIFQAKNMGFSNGSSTVKLLSAFCVIIIQMYHIIGVNKAYKGRGQGFEHRPSTKKFWHVYWYDEDESFHSNQCSWFQAMIYKLQKVYRKILTCEHCLTVFVWYTRNKNDEKYPLCPNCQIDSNTLEIENLA